MVTLNEIGAIPIWETDLDARLTPNSTLLVKCISEPFQNGQIWSGGWLVYIMDTQGLTYVLATRSDNKPKVIRRVNGLFSIGFRAGLVEIGIPSVVGHVTKITVPDK